MALTEHTELEIEEVMECHQCRCLHFTCYGCCPKCGASMYWQCRVDDPLRKEAARQAIQQEAWIRIYRALQRADDATLDSVITYAKDLLKISQEQKETA